MRVVRLRLGVLLLQGAQLVPLLGQLFVELARPLLCFGCFIFGISDAPSQGPLGVAGTALIGLILGWHYLARGRVLPLIVGHALYDTAVLSIMISAAESGLL